MPINCHFRDCKALLVTSLTHVSGAIASVQTFIFTFYLCLMLVKLELPHTTSVNSVKMLDGGKTTMVRLPYGEKKL